MKTKRKYSAATAVLLAVTVATPALAHEPEVAPFTMGVIQNDAFGAKVHSGKYEQAIERITRRGNRSPQGFAEQVNLCVAYAKTRALEKAINACDAAVQRAEERTSRLAHSGRSPEASAYRTDLALALSNRGVLMAATGHHDVAEQNFEKALELNTSLTKLVAGNLARLDSENPS
ncbi:MAG: hypothetical protein HKN64_03085 [Woeseiaceae bacterium]|nr:hypothetical protein [Woeseiaceae bacterium]